MRLNLVKMTAANLIVGSALALPLAASAAEVSYRYIDVAHFPQADIDNDRLDVDGDGLQLRGSLPVVQNVFVLAELQSLDLDFGVDVTRYEIGVGGHWPLNNTMDIVVRGGVAKLDVDYGRFDDDDTGLFAGVRLRAVLAPKIEVEGGVEHVRVEAGPIDDDTYLAAEGRYNFTPQFSAGAIVNIGGDIDLIGVQGRFSF